MKKAILIIFFLIIFIWIWIFTYFYINKWEKQIKNEVINTEINIEKEKNLAQEINNLQNETTEKKMIIKMKKK